MGKQQRIIFGGQSNPRRALDQSSERTVNWYPVEGPKDAQGNPSIFLYPTEGLTLFSSDAGGAIRGSHVVGNVYFFVVGQSLKTIDATGTITTLGTINTSGGAVRFADIFDQVMLVDGLDGWIYTISTGAFTQIVDPDFPNNVEQVAALGGYFIVTVPLSQSYAISNLSNGLSWDAIDTQEAQYDSDQLIACVNYLDVLWLFGERTIEQHVNEGNVDFPFTPRLGTSINYGLKAIDSIAKTGMNDSTQPTMCWLGTSARGGVIPLTMDSYGAVRPIFNPGIIEEMNTFEVTSDAYGFIYQRDDHTFYVLGFPTQNKTYVYDLTNGLSHERESYNSNTLSYDRWLPNFYANLGGQQYVADFRTGYIYSLEPRVYTEAGTLIRRKRRIPIFKENFTYKSINSLWILFNLGAALESGQGSDPQAMLRISRDGGRTFGAEMWRNIGTLGEFADMGRWDLLGTARKWCAELTVTDPIEWKVLDSFMDFDDEESSN